MAEILKCSGCAARFRVRLRDGAPRSAVLGCPSCGAPIALRRKSEDQGHLTREQISSEPVAAERTPEGDRGPAGWRSLERSAIFGRQPPPAPTPKVSPNTSKGPVFTEPPRPSLGLFGGHQSGDDQTLSPPQAPRLPEADRRDDAGPLASALLRELKKRRAAAPATALEETTEELQKEQEEEKETDGWFDDDLIAETVDAATEELFIVDDTPPDFHRLPRAPITDESSVDIQLAEFAPPAPAPAAPPPEPKGLSEQAAPPEQPAPTEEVDPADNEPAPERQTQSVRGEPSRQERPTPLVIEVDEKVRRKLVQKHGDRTGATYRLKIGGQTYGDIDFEGLLDLFRRGIWVVADEIAEGDGPWMPLDEHPIFERLRKAVADGMTALLLTHGRLLEERSEPAAPPSGPRVESATVEVDERPVASTSQVPTVQVASPTLPWSIALITTGVASAAVTFALMAEPTFNDDGPDEVMAAATAPVEPERERDQALKELIDQREAVDRAQNQAASIVARAINDDPVEQVEQALNDGNFSHARHLAALAYATTDQPQRLEQLFREAVADDPNLRQRLRTLEPDREADAIRALGGGASVTFRLVSGGTNRYAYKVDRQDWENGWRVEVAAYKLCEILPCDVYVPVNEPARISREDFEELYGRVDTPRQNSYAAERFDELIWHEEVGDDGEQREFLYGTLKEWIPRYTNWPIEYVETWQDWLRAEGWEEAVDEDFNEYLDRLDALYDRRFTQGLRRETEGSSVDELARQISNLHVFDYLTSNFDRYSGIEAYYGVNAHFADGQFVPLDNSAAFQFVPRQVMDRRLAPVERFSRPLIDAVRMLDPEVVNPILFPDPDWRDRRRLEYFWSQREKLLAHVDDLVERYGEAAIYSLD